MPLDSLKTRPPSPTLLRRQHSLVAVVLVLVIALAFLLVPTTGHRATSTVDQCAFSEDVAAIGLRLPHVSRALVSGGPLTIIAFGSSSTYGTGASSPDKTYPSRLAQMLALRFPGVRIEVLNRGVGGETATTTAQRIETDVIAAHPDLVIWQVGTNDVLRDVDPLTAADILRKGIARMQHANIDVVVMDVQYAPAILKHEHFRDMENMILASARAMNVPVIHRFAMMREWAEEGRIPLSVMLAHDRLHMTDVSYDCLARQVGRGIIFALRRRTAAAN